MLVETRRIAFIDIGTKKRSVYRFKAQDIETFVEASRIPAHPVVPTSTALRTKSYVTLNGEPVAQPVDFLAILDERKKAEKVKKKPARR